MKKTTRILWKIGLIAGLLLFGAACAQAQNYGASIVGFIEDIDGYVMNETAVRIDDGESGSFSKIYNRLQLEYANNWFSEQIKGSAVLRAVYDAVYSVCRDEV